MVGLRDEPLPEDREPLLVPVMADGRRTGPPQKQYVVFLFWFLVQFVLLLHSKEEFDGGLIPIDAFSLKSSHLLPSGSIHHTELTIKARAVAP